MNTKKQAVFLDRDGVINALVDRGDDLVVQGKKVRFTAPWTWDEFRIKDGVVSALQAMGVAGFLRIIVTNQPDITYGTMMRAEHDRIMAEVKKLPLEDIFICVHGRYDSCLCKKPRPGMITAAVQKWNIDLARSYLIGDTASDVGAGRAAACPVILIDSPQNQTLTADYRVADLAEAARLIATPNASLLNSQIKG